MFNVGYVQCWLCSILEKKKTEIYGSKKFPGSFWGAVLMLAFFDMKNSGRRKNGAKKIRGLSPPAIQMGGFRPHPGDSKG
jgi:hypothetical protein